MRNALAHSKNENGELHALREHLLATRTRAASYAQDRIQELLIILAALLHDLGKYRADFQAYLDKGGARGSVPHSCWGATVARAIDAWEASFAIAGHHGGLPDYSNWEVRTRADKSERTQCQDLLKAFFEDTGLAPEDLLSRADMRHLSKLEREVLTRFVFSCLVDADWLDTEAHFSPDKQALRENRFLDADWALAKVEAKLAGLGAASEPKPINILRNEARLEALQKADLPVGFFSLNLPTGLGKTLTSFFWALRHAKKNRLKRVIIVLPYLNIIDQTALILKGILGDDQVLEHHSAYLPPQDDENQGEAALEAEERKKLACENWDYPVIVTTTVQFYETLFSNKPGKCRKLHNIADAVVILDEVQTLAKELVTSTLDMLQDVQKVLNTSFVFCTATMPAFEKTASFPGVAKITQLIDEPRRLFEQTARVRFHRLNDLKAISLDRLQEAVSASGASALVIFNTKRPAGELFLALEKSGAWDAVYYLSTSLCPHHRKGLIRAIRADLDPKKQKRILLLSTQLIEAGVDLDFPQVFRELSPLEAVIQAAGRCNRESEMPGLGAVHLFQLAGAAYPDRSYKAMTKHLEALLTSGHGDLYDYSFFAEYYRQALGLLIVQKPLTREREELNFKTVGERYRLIESATWPVFIYNYNADSRRLYEGIRPKAAYARNISRDDYRAAQQYSVQVYEEFFRQNPGRWEELPCGLRIWNGGYHENLGLAVDPQRADLLAV